jgi:hypothetical protein
MTKHQFTGVSTVKVSYVRVDPNHVIPSSFPHLAGLLNAPQVHGSRV